MQKIYINVYSNTLLVFEYLCNRANIQENRVFVSALLFLTPTISLKRRNSPSFSFFKIFTALLHKHCHVATSAKLNQEVLQWKSQTSLEN